MASVDGCRAASAEAGVKEVGLLCDEARLLREQGRFPEAERLLRRAVALEPTALAPRLALGEILYVMGRDAEADAILVHALAMHPESADAFRARGRIATARHVFDVGERMVRHALTLDPSLAEAYCDLGWICHCTGRYVDAELAFRKALQLQPDHARSRCNLGFLQLLLGNYAEGWISHEARWLTESGRRRVEFKAPAWDGGDLAGRTLLIQHEQGFGDALQFVRYARLAAATAAKVIVVVPKPLRRLLEEIPEITVVCRMPMHYDLYCHMASLPYRFGTTPDNIPAEVPYLFVPVVARKRWSALFVDPVDSERRPLRVGIVWAGQALHVNDSLRSISFELLAPLFSVPGIQWVSLQKDGRPDEMDDLVAGRGWIDPMGDVDDFEDTAAIIDQLDLVITVCTSVTHLAGGLGKKVWTLLSAYPDWRWLITRAEDSPWYPTMRWFRQSVLGDWEPVIAAVRQALFEAAHAAGACDAPETWIDANPAPTKDFQVTLAETTPPIQTRLAEPPGNRQTTDDGPWLEKLEQRFIASPFWYHRIPLRSNIETPGWAPLNPEAYDLPERMDGLRVLDVGAWDGYWTFEALRRGAREVVAIDDLSDGLGVAADIPWRNWENFDVCREALGFDESVCKRYTMSVYDVAEATLGRFDVIFLFGVFNQLRHPLLGLERLAAVCDRSLHVEAAIVDNFSPYRGGIGCGYPNGQMLLEYYANAELGNAVENRWAPTLHALGAMLQTVGFNRIEGWKLSDAPSRQYLCRGVVRGDRVV